MAKIIVNNPRQVINGGAKKYYFKVKGLGGPKGDQGEKGDTGATGPQGPQGNAATVSVGSTTTLPVGYDATVTNTGSIYNAVLDFGIPQGPQGPQGAKGDKGDTGAKGDTGPRGPQGEKGTNATVYIGTTTTLNPGSQATVYNSGTDSNAVLNFGIPKGDTGPMPTIAQTTGQSTTEVMSQKATTDALSAKQDTLTAGANIQIENSTISATDTTYTAGNGLNLNGTEFSADTDILATKEDLEDYYTKPETDNLLAPKLEAEVIAELPATGEEGKLYLTPKAHTTQTTTGNPITATITDEAGKIESFQLDGDTTQQTYTGKNLLVLEGNTDNGVTGTVVNGNTVTVTGKATATSAKVATSPIDIPAGTYTLSIDRTYESVVNVILGTNNGTVSFRIASGQTSATATLTTDAYDASMWVGLTNGTTYNETFKLQLVAGSTADYDYEPYVGGVPSPNPDYPQAVNTVTGTQTVEVTGKNLLNPNMLHPVGYSETINGVTYTMMEDGGIKMKGTAGSTASTFTFLGVSWSDTTNQIPLDSSKAYMSSITRPSNTYRWYLRGLVNGVVTSINSNNNQTNISDCSGITYAMVQVSANQSVDAVVYPQVELGSTATSFAKYSKQTLPIDLGSIELCKLGEYQDYIYKSGSDWKIHKATKKMVLDGSETDWTIYGGVLYRTTVADYAVSNNIPYSPYLTGYTNVSASENVPRNTTCFKNSLTSPRFYIYYPDKFTSKAELTAWLQSNNTAVYYALDTATDTTITDQTLIAQLEAIRTASLENGTNTITNTATGSNLAGDMEIGYYGYNPRNRYDKWLWLNINNEYEQIGS